jgi:hypothetical protein
MFANRQLILIGVLIVVFVTGVVVGLVTGDSGQNGMPLWLMVWGGGSGIALVVMRLWNRKE